MREAGREDFEDLFRHEYPAVVRTVRLVLGDRTAAEDITQDAFAQLLVHWKKVSQYERPGAWVRRVALRMALRWRTRRKTEAAVVTRASIPPETPANDPDLYRAIRELSALQRAAVVLHYLEDRPVAEVADLLGCAEATAKTHLLRGRKRLAALLGESEASDVTR